MSWLVSRQLVPRTWPLCAWLGRQHTASFAAKASAAASRKAPSSKASLKAPKASNASPTATIPPTAPAAATGPVQLRDYQEECIQSVLASLARGSRRLGISLATGAGKTVIFTQLVDRIQAPTAEATQTLILAHRRELVEQAARHCMLAYPHKTVEMEMGALRASGTADITIASVQTLTSGVRLDKFDWRRFKLVLVDEAHHIVAPGYMRVLEHFGLAKSANETGAKGGDRGSVSAAASASESPVLVGVSATFSRFDGLALGAAVDEIVYHKDYIDMIDSGWLSDVIFTTVESKADLSRVRRTSAANGVGGGDFQTAALSRAVNTAAVNEVTVRTWLAKAAAAGRRSTLVFCVDLGHVADLTAKFRQHGIDARSISGNTPKAERAAQLEAFRQGAFPVLLNCGVFTEGTDLPAVDCVVLARPTRSRNLLVQMIGRGMRLHASKTNCHVIDMVATLASGVVTTPTLFGLDPAELVSQASVQDLRALRQLREAGRAADRSDELRAPGIANQSPIYGPPDAPPSPPDSVAFTDYDSVMDLIADTANDRHIRALSQYAWVQVGADRYVLSGPTGTFLRIEAEAGEETEEAARMGFDSDPLPRFRVVEIRALPKGVAKSPFAAPRELCRVETLADAVHAADSYAATIFPHRFIGRAQSWRNGPPTPGQMQFLRKLRGDPAAEGADPVKEKKMDNITRGAAADMITRLKHGARGRFADLAAQRRRRQREAEARQRDSALRQREAVSVGPLAM